MDVTGFVLHRLNKVVIAGIRAIAQDKERALAR
jgi:hypothetical protein